MIDRVQLTLDHADTTQVEQPPSTRRDHQQARALASYGRSAYQKLNARLRNDEPLTGVMQHMHDCLMGFMQPLDGERPEHWRDDELYRGGILAESAIAQGFWIGSGFTSTSTSHTIADFFIGDEKDPRKGYLPVFMTIKPMGALALSLNGVLRSCEKETGKILHYMRHEAETILAPDTMFFIQREEKYRDKWYDMPVVHLHVEAVAP